MLLGSLRLFLWAGTGLGERGECIHVSKSTTPSLGMAILLNVPLRSGNRASSHGGVGFDRCCRANGGDRLAWLPLMLLMATNKRSNYAPLCFW